MRTATELLALSHGQPCAGPLQCFYCGAPCDRAHRLKLSEAFNDWWSVAFPNSETICNGCVIALDEKLDMPGRDKPQKTRNWSWLITASVARPLGDIASIRNACLAPPSEPWALAIAVSGQKHVLFRTAANDGEPFTVQLETQAVTYTIAALTARLELAKRIAAASGKPALTNGLNTGLAMRLLDSLPMTDIDDWFSRAAEPINQLAAHICNSKLEIQNERAA